MDIIRGSRGGNDSRPSMTLESLELSLKAMFALEGF